MNATTASILAQIKTLSIDEQRALNKDLVAMINRGMRLKSMEAADKFTIGQQVVFDAKTKGIIKIQIEGYSRDGSRLKGKQIGGLRAGCLWTVAASLCHKA